MREWEQATWATGQTEQEVIRQVGKQVADLALRLTKGQDRVLVLCGQGNNGADARAASEHLLDRRVELLVVRDPAGELPRLTALLGQRPALVIDGLFGIGLNRPLSPEWVKFIQTINQAQLAVLALDVPSGLNADTGKPEGAALEAAVTLTVGAPKLGLLSDTAWPFVGRLEVASDVGLVPCPIQSELQWVLARDFDGFPPRRPVHAHKGSFGHLAVIAGSLGYHGAAVLSARGAQRARPGLITLHALEPIYHVIASQLQAVMVSPWVESNRLPGNWTAALAGPGLAAMDLPDMMRSLVRLTWRDSRDAMVVDASALDWLAVSSMARDPLRVMTPHPGEAARLLGTTVAAVQANRLAALRSLSKRFGNTWVVLKGHHTMIGRSTGEVLVNSSGNPGLAQGGSGDILAGYLAGLVAQPALQATPQQTIAYAVWQHGAAADRLQLKQPNWIVEDLIAELGNT
jgi:NAD(P)H-hydrate epimerase